MSQRSISWCKSIAQKFNNVEEFTIDEVFKWGSSTYRIVIKYDESLKLNVFREDKKLLKDSELDLFIVH